MPHVRIELFFVGAAVLACSCHPRAKPPAAEVSTAPSVADKPPSFMPPAGAQFSISPRARMVPARDPRLLRWTPPREMRAIEADAKRLESQVDASAPNSLGRAQLISEAADAYAELAHAVEMSTPHEVGRCDCDVPRAKAISLYRELARNYADEPQSDVTLYYLGLEHELARNPSVAGATYRKLIDRPTSRFQPFAIFGVGEILYIYAHRPDEARNYYQRILELPGSAILPDAILRLAQLAERSGDNATSSALYRRLNAEYPQSDAALHGRLVPP